MQQRRVCMLSLLLMTVLSWTVVAEPDKTPPGNAANPPEAVILVDPEMPVRGESIMSLAGHKFVRGLTNTITGVGEIPRQMIISYRDDGPALFVPVGFFTGIFMTVARTAYGAVETVTFIIPLDGSYDSMLTPDYVWGPIKHQTAINEKR